VKILDTLKFHDILRYFLAGGFFLVSYFRATKDLELCPISVSASELTLFTGIALVAGSAIYVLYRALLYPIIGRFVLFLALKSKPAKYRLRHFWPYKLLPLEMELDEKRWVRHGDEKNTIQSSLDEWGVQVHFLYCVALSMCAGNLISLSDYLNEPLETDWWIFGGIIVFFVAGLASDYRAWTYELRLRNRVS